MVEGRPRRPVEPETEYVRERVQGLEFEEGNWKLVKDLLNIERFARQGGPKGMASSWHYGSLRSRHPEAWLEVHRELAPEKVEEIREQQAAAREAQREHEEEQREIEEAWRAWWREHGGIA